MNDGLPNWVRYYPVPEGAKERVTSDGRHRFIEFTHAGKQLRFDCRDEVSRWRIATLFTKEPETHYWLEEMPEGDVFYDIGANVGLYAIYATVMSGVRTHAFEPESQNFASLYENITLNELTDRCTGYCLGIGAQATALTHLAVSEFHVGRSLHSVGGPVAAGGLRQGCLSVSLDHLVYELGLPAPNHVKIDVDGLEGEIIQGARRLIADERLRSVMVEFNDTPGTYNILHTLKDAGFELSLDQLRIKRDGLRETEEIARLVAGQRLFGNFLFSRDKVLLDGARAVIDRYLSGQSQEG